MFVAGTADLLLAGGALAGAGASPAGFVEPVLTCARVGAWASTLMPWMWHTREPPNK